MCILEGQTMPFPGAPSLSLHEQHGIASLTSCRSCNEYMRWQRWWALMLTCCTYVPMGGRGFCAERAFPVHWASCHISWSLVMIGDRFSITWLLTTNPNVNVKTLLEGDRGWAGRGKNWWLYSNNPATNTRLCHLHCKLSDDHAMTIPHPLWYSWNFTKMFI